MAHPDTQQISLYADNIKPWHTAVSAIEKKMIFPLEFRMLSLRDKRRTTQELSLSQILTESIIFTMRWNICLSLSQLEMT